MTQLVYRGNSYFKEEQAEIKNEANSLKVATIMGIDHEWMVNYFCKPKL